MTAFASIDTVLNCPNKDMSVPAHQLQDELRHARQLKLDGPGIEFRFKYDMLVDPLCFNG